MAELLRLLSLQDSSTRVVMLSTAGLAIAAAMVGSLAMLRRRALVGDAVAHASLPGICVAWFVAGDRSLAVLLLGAFVLGLACMATMALVQRLTKSREDATTAIAISGFFGLGIVLSRMIQNQPGGNRAGLDGFLFGKAASAVTSDAWLVLAVAGLVVAIVLALRKEFGLLCFDRDFAVGLGRPVHRLDGLLLVLVALVTVPLMAALTWLVRFTKLGKAMRAVAQNPTAAALMGIDVERVIGATFFIGGALGGFATVVYAIYNQTVNFQMGYRMGMDAFIAAVLGGIGNLPGAVLGGLMIGVVRAMSDGYIEARWTNSVVFGILILILVFRPAGLLGAKLREKV